MHKDIDEITKYLFDRAYSDNLTDDQEDEILDQVDQQISDFGWKETYSSWMKYLVNTCDTSDSVINFANLFWWYGGQDHPITDPYRFLGYLFYRTGFNLENNSNANILDSLATYILPKAGYREADLVHNPYYTPENDPQIHEAVDSYKSGHC